MEPLTFKIITDADDRGVRQYQQSLSKVDLTGRKASGALKGFIGDLGEIKSGTDVASSALNAFSRILGGTLVGTAAVVIGKTLVDSFNRVNAAVKEAKKSVEDTNKEIGKIALAGVSFETASKQADVLVKNVDALRENLDKINKSRLDSFMAGLTGGRKELEALIATQQKAAEEAQTQAIVQGLLDLERKANIDEITKAQIAAAEPYNKLIELARKLGNQELLNKTIIEQQAARQVAREKVIAEEKKKAMEEETKAREAQSKELQKIAKEEADFELKMIEATASGKSAAYLMEKNQQIELLAQERERISEVQKTISQLKEREAQLQRELDVLLKIRAAEAAGRGGTSRGEGQKPSSFETGLEEQLLRERYKSIKQRDDEYFEFVREKLRAQGDQYGDWAVQNEIARMAMEQQHEAIMAGNDEIKNITKELAEAREKLASLARTQEILEKNAQALSDSIFAASDSAYKFASNLVPAAGNMVDSLFGVTNATKDMTYEFLDAGKGISEFGSDLAESTQKVTGFTSALERAIQGLSNPLSSGGGLLGIADTLASILKRLDENLVQLRSYSFAADPASR